MPLVDSVVMERLHFWHARATSGWRNGLSLVAGMSGISGSLR